MIFCADFILFMLLKSSNWEKVLKKKEKKGRKGERPALGLITKTAEAQNLAPQPSSFPPLGPLPHPPPRAAQHKPDARPDLPSLLPSADEPAPHRESLPGGPHCAAPLLPSRFVAEQGSGRINPAIPCLFAFLEAL